MTVEAVKPWQILFALEEYSNGVTERELKSLYCWWFGRPETMHELDIEIDRAFSLGWIGTTGSNNRLVLSQKGSRFLKAIRGHA